MSDRPHVYVGDSALDRFGSFTESPGSSRTSGNPATQPHHVQGHTRRAGLPNKESEHYAPLPTPVSPVSPDIPQYLLCPITRCPMKDPVVDKEGFTYERAAIMQWLQTQSTSPVTRNALKIEDLSPNRALLNAMESMQLSQSKDTHAAPMPAPIPAHLPMLEATDTTRAEYAAPGPSHTGPFVPDSQAEQVKLTVTAVSALELGDDVVVHVKMTPPERPTVGPRPRLDLCCVIDVSGSMNAEATLKDDAGNEEGDGLSVLDVVRHGVKTIMQLLGDGDRLAVVMYSSKAAVVHKLTLMNAAGKALSYTKLDQLTPQGTTNLWDGLQTGLDVLRHDQVSGRTQCLMLLTDGVPNVEPPRGHIPMLRRYYAKYPAMRDVVLGTFGFGYKLNSTLLRQIADEGDGGYSFIPDVGLVGTVFIHAVANVLTVAAKNAVITVEPTPGGLPLMHSNAIGSKTVNLTPSEGGLEVRVGSIMFGQDRDVCFRIPRAAWAGVTVDARYTDACSGRTTALPRAQVTAFSADRSAIYHVYRLKAEHAMAMAAHQSCEHAYAQQLINDVKMMIQKSAHTSDPNLAGLLQDIEGQAREAVSREEWHSRWGRHYLFSLSSAHGLQQCNNFKDPGVQFYGGSIFCDSRDIADEAFSKLDPPVPTRDRVNAEYALRVAKARGDPDAVAAATMAARELAKAAVSVSMSRYNCASAPCFAGGCTVATPSGTVPIESLCRGDFVLTPHGTAVRVVCLVVTKCVNNTAFFVDFPGGLRITPYHPVRINGVWHFPQDVHSVHEHPCPAVYNLVVDDTHIVYVNGVECITLGHNLKSSSVIRHPYFGSQQIVADLQQCRGWSTGRVWIERMVRQGHGQTVSGFVEAQPGSWRNDTVN
eukprot:m.23030 g.23030  ORF g.23030 m.23030 type:complete len:874 (-) comp4048_c0_seq1:218-2839(-)